MELEKVIRIVATFIAIAALAIFVAGKMIFADSGMIFPTPMLIVYVICMMVIWRPVMTDGQNAHGHK